MTYPIPAWGVEHESVRGWSPIRNSLRFTQQEAKDYLDDITSTYPDDAHRYRLRRMKLTPA